MRKCSRAVSWRWDNSIDVLVVGDSEALQLDLANHSCGSSTGLPPTCAAPRRSRCRSYRYLRQAFEHQSPRVVILETNAIFRTYKLNDYLLSRAKVLFSVLRYHDRWKTLSVNDFGGEARYTWTDDLKVPLQHQGRPGGYTEVYKPTDAEQRSPCSTAPALRK